MAVAAEGVFQTQDMGIAAYLKIHGLDVIKAEKVEGGNFDFLFRDPEGKAQVLQVAYVNSECQRFDAAVRALKKLLYGR